jgi:hypothetical protein
MLVSKQNTVHFPTVNERAKPVSFNAAKYATEFGVLREEFRSRFQDFREHETCFRIFPSSFEADVEAVPKNSKWTSKICRAEKNEIEIS